MFAEGRKHRQKTMSQHGNGETAKQTERSAGRERPPNRQRDVQAERETAKQTERRTGRERSTNRQRDVQTGYTKDRWGQETVLTPILTSAIRNYFLERSVSNENSLLFYQTSDVQRGVT